MAQRARVRSLYLLIFLNVALLALSVILLVIAHSQQARLDSAERRSYAGCVRGNVLREVARYAMEELGSPERARLPELQKQDCAVIYPGGAR